jgi:O-antigen/teichoic acid export membrane protein
MGTSKGADHNSLNILAGGAAIVIVFGVVGYALSFLSSLLAARYFGPSNFGIYSLATTLLGIATLIAYLGIPAGISRFVPYYHAQHDERSLVGYLRFVLAVPLFISLAISVLFFVFAENIAHFFSYPAPLVQLLRIVSIIIPFRIISDMLGSIITARKLVLFDQLRYNVMEKGSFLLGLIIVLFFHLNLYALMVVMASSILVSFFYSIVAYNTKVRISLRGAHTTHYREWLNFSLPLLFSGFLILIISWSDRIFIGKFLTSADLGIYSVVFSLVTVLVFFQSAFSVLFVPLIAEHYARDEHDQISFIFRKAAGWVFGLSFPVFLVLLLYSKQLLTIFYGPSYAAGYLALVILSIGFLINISTGLNKEVILLHGLTKFLFLNSFFIATYNIVLNLLLVPSYGILGAAVASSSAMILDNIICLAKARRYEHLSFDMAYSLKFIVAGITSFVVALFIFRIPGIAIASRFALSSITYILLFGLLLLLLRTLQKEEIDIMLDMEKRLGLNLAPLRRVLRRLID